MGIFDKIKGAVDQIKEDNKNFASTTKRMNEAFAYFGNVNRRVTNGDFGRGCYINLYKTDGEGVIYSTSEDDYVFKFGDVESISMVGVGPKINIKNVEKITITFNIKFKDGKTAVADIIKDKSDDFIALMK